MLALSKRYKLGVDSLYRHKANHLPAPVRAKLLAGPDLDGVDLDRLREGEEQSLLAGLVALRARLFHSLSVAEDAGDGHMISRLSGQLHRNYELVGKLVGSLSTGGTTINHNLLVAPIYLELRGELLGALRPYPEAARAVAAALHQIEHKAAEALQAEAGRGLGFVGGRLPAGRPPVRLIDGGAVEAAERGEGAGAC